MSIHALEKLHCSKCAELMVHRAGVCTHCGTANNVSGMRPVRRNCATQLFNQHNGRNYNAAIQAAGDKRRARAARHKFQRGRT
jgi:hypothetical protein